MVRLIDADKLKKNIENAFSWFDNSDEETLDPELVDFHDRVIKMIDNAPALETESEATNEG